MKKTILVTGAAGFIGSHLCEKLLYDGLRVVGVDNFDPFYSRELKEKNLEVCRRHPQFEFIEGDAGDVNVLGRTSQLPDVVIHLAAKAGVLPSLAAPADYIRTNILLTNNLLEWMKNAGIKKLIFASSSSVYGNTNKVPFDESQDTSSPFSPYAFTKRSGELMNYMYHQLYGFDVLNLRFFTVYGERQRPDLAIHKFVKNIFTGKPIHVYGEGDTSRDYTYWKDTVNGVSLALKYMLEHNGVCESINLGNNKPVRLNELIKAIAEVSHINPVIIYEAKKPGDVDITFADVSKATTMLGYNPSTSLKEGLSNFINWYKENSIPALH